MLPTRTRLNLPVGLITALCAATIPALAQSAADEAKLPMRGKSFGGAFRAGPSTDSRQIGSLRKGHKITILENAGSEMNGFDWIKIRFNGRTGYQWGGVICSQAKVKGIYQTCREAGM